MAKQLSVGSPFHIERARPSDAADLFQLLETNHLPLAGLADHLGTALVAREHGRLVGSAALEVYPDGVLLRSVAVAQDLQGQGLGQALTSAAIGLAESLNAKAIYLLTTTADHYFPRFGFEQIARAEVPQTVQASVEFTSACPSSATVMRRSLTNRPIVCTLQPGEFNRRAMALLPGVVKRSRALVAIDGGYRLDFAASSTVLHAIVETIDAERQCCRFLRFRLTVEPDGESVILEVTGPPGTTEFLADVFEQ